MLQQYYSLLLYHTYGKLNTSGSPSIVRQLLQEILLNIRYYWYTIIQGPLAKYYSLSWGARLSTTNCGNPVNAIKGLTKSDGGQPGDFRDWHYRLAAVLSVARRHIASLIKGKALATEETTATGTQASLDRAIAGYGRTNEDRAGTCGDGQQALQELVNKYNKDGNNSKSTGPQDKQEKKEYSIIKAGSNDEAGQKPCSVHKTISHDDSERYPSQSNSTHIASAVLSAISPPVNDDDNPSASNLLEEGKSSTTTVGASSTGAGVSSPGAGTPSLRTKNTSSGTGTSSSKTGTLPKQAGVSSSSSGSINFYIVWFTRRCICCFARGRNTPAGVTPDALHHKTAGTAHNPSVEETFDSTHAKRASRKYPRPRVRISPTPIETHFGSRRRKTG